MLTADPNAMLVPLSPWLYSQAYRACRRDLTTPIVWSVTPKTTQMPRIEDGADQTSQMVSDADRKCSSLSSLSNKEKAGTDFASSVFGHDRDVQ